MQNTVQVQNTHTRFDTALQISNVPNNEATQATLRFGSSFVFVSIHIFHYWLLHRATSAQQVQTHKNFYSRTPGVGIDVLGVVNKTVT